MHNALAPDRMTAEERLREVGEILAAGLLRLRAKKQGSGHESSLDLPANRSVHGRKVRGRERR